MFPKSIRWQLPLSYAAIALLAALALGLVLLLTLRNYYTRLELDYLNSNAREIGAMLRKTLQSEGQPPLNPEAETKAFSFLSQARVRVLSPQRQVLIDSGPVEPRNMLAVAGIPFQQALPHPPEPAGPPQSPALSEATAMMTEAITSTSGVVFPPGGIADNDGLRLPDDYLIWIFSAGEARSRPASRPVYGEVRERREIRATLPTLPITGTPLDGRSVIWVNRSLYGFDLNPDVRFEARRSDQVVQQPFFDQQGHLLGYVELSEGPTYGWDIVEGVARGWAIASAVAVLLAAGVGLIISRRISAPLVALTDVTTRMAEGDLSSRANITRQDELGTLAHSFNEMAERVEGTVMTLRHFASDAAHELNTPLTALKTNLELAAHTANGEQATYFERSQGQIARLESLTKSLLELSRLEVGAANVEMSDVDLVKLAKEASEFYASRAEQVGIQFTLDLPRDPILVHGNAALLQRAIGNLLDNAIKFTPSGGAVALRVQRDGDRVRVTVEDTGIGIPAEDLPQLFGRFHRARNATGYPGNGLGLAIVKAIVEGHGGRVSAENTGRGARFSMWLLG
jgi:signal transduction histidine kinase